MFKIMTTLLIFTLALNAIDKNQIIGNWNSTLRTLNNGTETIEKEYLSLNANSTFSLVILVSLQKGDAYIKDMRIEVAGTWESRDHTLVYVIKTVNIPNAKEVYGISQQSLENLAENFKSKYENDNIHIGKIKYIDNSNLTVIGEKLRETQYSR